MRSLVLASIAVLVAVFASFSAEAAGVGTVQGAQGVLKRMIPSHADRFILTIDPALRLAEAKALGTRPRLPNTTYDTYVVLGQGGKVYVNATSAIGLTSGVYWYLKNVTKCQVTWGNNRTGDQLRLPLILPDVKLTTVHSAVPWRYAWNMCTFSYSGVWWTAERWQREIDWMAFHGVNMPLAFTGQEYVWVKFFQRYNVSLEELSSWFTGPAFLTWGRFGNIRGFTGPLSEHWITGQKNLQLGILAQMRSLGMTTILPCFAGHVPSVALKVWPDATFTRSQDWNNFPLNESYVWFLDPTDALYTKIGKEFASLVVEEFGTDHYYNCDTYNEVNPTNSTPSYLRAAGAAVVDALKAADPQATWVMQGWLFHNGFWTQSRVEAYLSGIKDTDMVVLDLNSEAGALADQFHQYYGKPWIWNMLHNYGGVRGVYGNMTRIATGPMEDLHRTNSTMVGIGFTPEAIEQNPAMYELLTDTFWHSNPFDPLVWLKAYVEQRYGVDSPQAWKAWQTLFAAVYNQPGEPRSDIEWVPEWIQASFGWENGDATTMLQAAIQYLEAQSTVPDAATNGPYQYDLVDITRQASTMFFSDVHRMLDNIALAYTNKTDSLIRTRKLMLTLIEQLSDLLGSNINYLLGTWTQGSALWSKDDTEAALFLYGAKNQITMWGPQSQICDYAAKAWDGLYRDYYHARWKYFLDLLVSNNQQGKYWSEYQYQQGQLNVEQTWDHGSKQYSNQTSSNGAEALKIAEGLLELIQTPISRGGNGTHPDESGYTKFPGINLIGGVDFQVNPMWTRDITQLGILCDLDTSCTSFTKHGIVKGNGPDSFFTKDGYETLYIRNSEKTLLAKAKNFTRDTTADKMPLSLDDFVSAVGTESTISHPRHDLPHRQSSSATKHQQRRGGPRWHLPKVHPLSKFNVDDDGSDQGLSKKSNDPFNGVDVQH